MYAELSVERMELKGALKTLKFSDRTFSIGEVALSFKDGWLELQTQGISVQIAASGIWPGRARISLRSLRPILLNPPKDNPLIISFHEGHVLFGSYSVPSHWEDISPPAALVAMDISWIEVLKLRFKHSEAALISGGMGPKIAEAENKLKTKVAMARDYLIETGVTEQDLVDLVYRKLKESIKD